MPMIAFHESKRLKTWLVQKTELKKARRFLLGRVPRAWLVSLLRSSLLCFFRLPPLFSFFFQLKYLHYDTTSFLLILVDDGWHPLTSVHQMHRCYATL